MVRLKLALILAAVSYTSASAETIITCSGGSGWAYYFDNSDTSGGQWVEDGMSKGSVTLVTLDDGADMIIQDAIGIISARSQGATVTVLKVSDPFITVLVDYHSGAVELYTFNLRDRKLTWSQHKFGVAFDKGMTLVGDCQ